MGGRPQLLGAGVGLLFGALVAVVLSTSGGDASPAAVRTAEPAASAQRSAPTTVSRANSDGLRAREADQRAKVAAAKRATARKAAAARRAAAERRLAVDRRVGRRLAAAIRARRASAARRTAAQRAAARRRAASRTQPTPTQPQPQRTVVQPQRPQPQPQRTTPQRTTPQRPTTPQTQPKSSPQVFDDSG